MGDHGSAHEAHSEKGRCRCMRAADFGKTCLPRVLARASYSRAIAMQIRLLHSHSSVVHLNHPLKRWKTPLVRRGSRRRSPPAVFAFWAPPRRVLR